MPTGGRLSDSGYATRIRFATYRATRTTLAYKAHLARRTEQRDLASVWYFNRFNPAITGVVLLSLGTDEVRTIAQLTRLRLDEKEFDATAQTLSGIVDLFDALERIDTSDTEPMAHPLDLVARLRDDHAHPVPAPERYQALASDAEAGLYRVPRVIE